jgi:plasmid stabilization system protein ParE
MAKKKQHPPSDKAFEIIWTQEAQQALWSLWSWLADKSEDKADALFEEIREKVELLAKHPLLGPLLPEGEDTLARQLLVSKHYKVIYRVEQDTQSVFILTIHPTRIPFALWSDL